MLSIIVPILNEAENLPVLLLHLEKEVYDLNATELVLVDGGSTDTTLQIFNHFQKKLKIKSKLIHAQRGRAKQMNTGARSATGDILYFLHADSFPPRHFDQLIKTEVQKGNPAGCFRMQFMSKHWWLKLVSWFTKFEWRACRGGDQSQFITKELFDIVGGYDERYIIYEDNILINALYARSQFVVIQKPLKSSARMYEKYGVWYVQYVFLNIYIKKWMGASAEDLLAYYSKHLKK